MSIGDWIQKQNSQPVKDESRLIFRGILKGLKRLHENGRCHGNLWNGVYIDGQHAVLADYSDYIDLLAGMKKGLSHSHKLLRHVNDIIQSHGFKSFVRLYKQMPSVFGDLRFVSNYTLINFVSYYFYK